MDQKILRTTSGGARWHVIPANNKQFARVATLKAINRAGAQAQGELTRLPANA